MKNFTLLSVVALLTSTSLFASVNPKTLRPLQRARAAERTEIAARPDAHRQTAKRTPAKVATRRQAPADAIVTPPEGKLYENMVVSFEGIAYSFFGFADASTDAGFINLVEAADGTLYIQNLTPNLADDELYWIKAEKVDDNGNYVIHKQPAGYYAYYEEVDYITRLEYVEDEEGGYYYEALNTDIPMTWKDGVLSTTAQINEDHPFGIVYASDDDPNVFDWEGETYYNFRAEVQTDTYAVPPADAQIETFAIKYTQAGSPMSSSIKVAFSGDTVYLHFSESTPGWVVGTIDGDKILVKAGQYMGVDSQNGTHQYLHITVSEVAIQEDEQYGDYTYDNFLEMLDEDVFSYDSQTRTITAPHTITIDGSKTSINASAVYVQPVMYPFVEVAAVPADPQISLFYNYEEKYENGEVYFHIPTQDIQGNYITPEKLSFSVYFDDTEECFEFEADEYQMEQSMTEIPVLFSNDVDIMPYSNMNYVAFYFEVSQFVGVQSIYRGAGEVHKSNIVLFDVNTEETSVVNYDDPLRQGVSAVATKSVASERYFDVTGRRVAADAKGLVLKTLTFGDGTSKTYKVIRK